MALISALMVMVIIMIIASAFVTMTASDVRSTQTSGDAYQVLHLAEAGVEYAMYLNRHNLSLYPTSDDAYAPLARVGGTDTYDRTDPMISLWDPANPMEHVVVNDVAYDDDWLSSGRYCGTFRVYEELVAPTPPDTVTRVRIVSTGLIREVPGGWDWDADDFANEMQDAGSDFHNIRAQRTIQVEIPVDTDTGAFSDSSRLRLLEEKWMEQFR